MSGRAPSPSDRFGSERGAAVLLLVTGSVAVVKLPELIDQLLLQSFVRSLDVVLSESAAKFLGVVYKGKSVGAALEHNEQERQALAGEAVGGAGSGGDLADGRVAVPVS